MKQLKWVWQYIRKYRVQYILTLLLSTAVIGLALVAPYIYGEIVKEVFEKGNQDVLLPLLGLVVGVTAAKGVIRYLSLVSYESMSQDMLYKLRQDIYQRIQSQSFSFFDSNKVGDIMSRITGDLDAVRHFVAFVIYQMYENILIFIVALIVMFSISWQLTLLLLAVSPFICYLALTQSKKVKPAFSNIREQFARLNSVCQENISGNRVVKAFTREDYEMEKFEAENKAFYDANVGAAELWLKYLPKQDFLAGSLTLIMIVAGGILVIYDKLEIYQLVIINGYLWAVSQPMRLFGWLVNDVSRFVASLDKVYSLMETKIDIKNTDAPKDGFFDTIHGKPQHKPSLPSKKDKVKGQVEFKNVSFSYNKYSTKSNVLKNISFKAGQGQTIGIVGPTGAGKTTLINLISRFYDVTGGSVCIDGVDVRRWNLQSLRSSIAFAMQDVFLFSDTVEGNLAYGTPDAQIDALYSAANVADAAGFIEKMEDGYDTIIGERGVGLSGGQRQRLSLARAVAVNPSILILDDTTSAVDMETEHEIQTALNKHYSDKTKFIVAHRISSVKSADLILVIVGGKIIESGTHNELVAKKGYYYGLFIGQYGDLAEKEIEKNIKGSTGNLHSKTGGGQVGTK